MKTLIAVLALLFAVASPALAVDGGGGWFQEEVVTSPINADGAGGGAD